jgi:hypothetical protein
VQPNPAEPQKDGTKNPKKDWWDKAKPWVELTGVILLAIYTGFTIAMYFANKETADAAKSAADTAAGQLDEMRLDQRPWIIVKFTPMQPSVNGKVFIPMVLNNTGKSPARNIDGNVAVRLHQMNEPIDFRNPAALAAAGIHHTLWTDFKYGVFAPNDITSIPQPALLEAGTKYPQPMQWTQPMQDRYTHGETYIEAHGEITYDDAIGTRHWTKLCVIITAQNYGALANIGQSCSMYNSVDDNK